MISTVGQISKYFTWHEALYLPRWDRLANEADGLTEEIKSNLINLFYKMDDVRVWSGAPIVVHEAYRPPEYNSLIKGARQSQHLLGNAVDFHSEAIGIENFKIKVMAEIEQKNMLDIWKMRMERNTIGWIHLDQMEIIHGQARYFFP